MYVSFWSKIPSLRMSGLAGVQRPRCRSLLLGDWISWQWRITWYSGIMGKSFNECENHIKSHFFADFMGDSNNPERLMVIPFRWWRFALSMAERRWGVQRLGLRRFVALHGTCAAFGFGWKPSSSWAGQGNLNGVHFKHMIYSLLISHRYWKSLN